MRIKSRWHNKNRPKTPEDLAGTLAFISWRIAAEGVKHMENEGFVFKEDSHYLGLIEEFLAFLIQLTDRFAFEHLSEDSRQRFVTTLALKLADTLQDNAIDLFGPGDYRARFIDKLNQRLDDYAEFGFSQESLNYSALRYFAACMKEVLEETQNRWVIEHIIEIESPNAFTTLKKGVASLFAQSDEAKGEGEA